MWCVKCGTWERGRSEAYRLRSRLEVIYDGQSQKLIYERGWPEPHLRAAAVRRLEVVAYELHVYFAQNDDDEGEA